MEIILPPYVEIYDKLQDGKKNKDCFIQNSFESLCGYEAPRGADEYELKKRKNGGF